MKKTKYKRYIALAIVVAIFLLPWMFYAQFPDIINPPTSDFGVSELPVPVPNFAPIPVTAPIELQYEAYPLKDVMDWLKNRVPDTVITMPMLETIDSVCQAKNISLGIMLGIVDAEHSLLSMSAMSAGGWQQIQDAPINPFSYGWTDVNTVPMIGVQNSAIGAASIVTLKAHQWQAMGWGAQSFADFLKSLSLYYRLGQNGVPATAASWEQAVSQTASGLSGFMSASYSQDWENQISTDMASGIKVFGQSVISAKILSIVPKVMSKAWSVAKAGVVGTYFGIASGGQAVASAVGADGAVATGINLLFDGLAGLTAAGVAAIEAVVGSVVVAA